MRVDLFDFDLPEALIALRPARPRDSARLLGADREGRLTDAFVRDLPAFLRPGDLLVVNDTRVIPAALKGRRAPRKEGDEGAAIEALLHHREDAAHWRAFAKPLKRLREGDRLRFGEGLEALVAARREGEIVLRFDKSGAELDRAIAVAGAMPLPPYIAAKRPVDADDAADYQTLFAREAGAVAAPTAGLHFTPALMAALAERGVETLSVTLHVGAGTFLPMKADDTDAHVMHGEWRAISAQTAEAINMAKRAGRRIIAVGTTALRTLESSADANGVLQAAAGETHIFITPGYRFKIVDMLWTNFHLPRSTLFMLVAAFIGLERAHALYAHAIAQEYRFYSYGDACLLERAS